MKTILGLDLGVASIGWAIITEGTNNQKLIDTGVRVIPIDSEISGNFSKGTSTSKNQDRRLKRSARRNNHRYKLRKHFLLAFLKANNFPSPDEALFHLSAKDLFELRHRALSEKIELKELVRIWFHLNQKRGYIDSRKSLNEEENDTKYVEKIKEASKNIYKEHPTLGSYFYHKLLENPIYRIKSGDDKERIFLIEDYKREFDLIWENQKKHHPKFLNDLNFDTIRNKIIFYKRRLKSQKHLIGDCRFELHHKCMPISSPIATEIRIWQDVNKLRITSKHNEIFELTKDQKKELFNFLNSNAKISEKDLLKKFQFPSATKEYKINFEKEIKGNPYRAKIIQAFSKAKEISFPIDDFDCLNKDFDKHSYFKLWHLLYATEETSNLKKVLQETFSFSDSLIQELLKINIKTDFAALSSRAARKILPFLREGKIYSEACGEAGYNHSDSITKEDNEKRELVDIQILKHIKPNELRNPTVEKILNQLINLLKALDLKGYKFDEIRIELARDLKKNAKQRQSITKINKQNEENNKKIYEILKEHGFRNPSRRDIEKYKLWEEFDRRSPYEPLIGIELEDLFDKAKYEIEHIIPKSRYFDDSLNNRTIARVHVNKEKDNLTAFDYMSSKSPELLHQYQEFIKHAKINETKRKYLKMSGNEIPEDFITRQLNETRYITKETLKILKKVCMEVHSTSGTVTDYLRHHWGYDNVLMDLNFDRVAPDEIIIKEINGHKRRVIKNWDKRLDHRHHALDAIVIACTKKSYIHQLNTLNANFQLNTSIKNHSIKQMVPFEYETVKNSISNILISFKPGKRVASLKIVGKDRWGKEPCNLKQKTLVPRGALHEESVYGVNKKYSEPIPISKVKDINSLAIDWQKDLILAHLSKYDNDLSLAQKNLKKDPIVYGDNKVLEKVVIYFNKPVKRYNLQYNTQNKFDLKAAESIVNQNVKRLVIERLEKHGNKPELAFKNLKEDPLYFNKEKNILINSVRCYTKLLDDQILPEEGGYIALHESANGNTLNTKQGKTLKTKNPVDYVKGGNNHHIAIYENENGERFEECVSFFEAFERKKMGKPSINRNHPLGYRFVTSIQQNEMFVFGIQEDQLDNLIQAKNYSLISNHLFRVQKIQNKDYTFRHHLETKLDDSKTARELNKFIRISNLNKVIWKKVRLKNSNEIQIIND